MYEVMQPINQAEYVPVQSHQVETQSQEELSNMPYMELGEAVKYLAEVEADVLPYLTPAARRADKYVHANFAIGIDLMFMNDDQQATFRATEEGKKYYDALQQSNEGWAMAYAAAEHQRQQDELLQAIKEDAGNNTLTPTGLRAQKAGFTVIPRGKKPETKKSFTLSDLVPDNSQEKKKSA